MNRLNRLMHINEAANLAAAAKNPVKTDLPHLFSLRDYQKPFWDSIDSGKYKRGIVIWHRRAGKEKCCWNLMIKKAHEKVGNYFYLFPNNRQGRKIIWDGKDKSGKAFLAHLPKETTAKINNTEMKIILTNGSIIQIAGTDEVDNLMGTNPIFVVFSEYSIQKPSAWEYIRPILIENEGTALFNFTPRGKNHAYDLFLQNKDNPQWFVQVLSVEDTNVVSKEDLDAEIASGMSNDMVQQEFYCSFDRGREGSWYGRYLQECDQDGRITNVPYDVYAKVDTFWDLGVGDACSIIFAQRVGQEVHIIDHYEAQGLGLNHYIDILDEKNYSYGQHFAPHDIKVRELASGARTRLEIARDLGVSFNVLPNMSIFEGIELARGIFNKVWFDEKNCKYLLKCLENYHKQYIEKYNVYADQPVHDFSSHAADAFRYMAVAYASSFNFKTKSLAELEMEDNLYRRKV